MRIEEQFEHRNCKLIFRFMFSLGKILNIIRKSDYEGLTLLYKLWIIITNSDSAKFEKMRLNESLYRITYDKIIC